jgi:hypothetical protein
LADERVIGELGRVAGPGECPHARKGNAAIDAIAANQAFRTIASLSMYLPRMTSSSFGPPRKVAKRGRSDECSFIVVLAHRRLRFPPTNSPGID